MNKVLVIGRMVRDPEVKETASGIKYVRFTLAVNKFGKKDEADFIPMTAWRGSADFLGNYIKKGNLLSVEGSFTSSTYMDKETGKNITRYEVTCSNVQGLEPKKTAPSDQVKSESTQNVQFEETPKADDTKTNDVPWEMDL